MNKKTLEEYRKELGKSKMQFANMLSIPYTTYLRYEADLQKAPFAEVVRICDILKIDIKQIAC